MLINLFKLLETILHGDKMSTDIENLKEDDIIKNLGLKDVFVIKRSAGIIILKKTSTLTDMLTNLIPVGKKSSRDWKEEEYSEYLSERSG